MLGTLADLKGKMDIPASDVSRDDALTLALEAASVKILDVCRYSETAVTGHQQILRNVQYNRDVLLELRPVNVAVNAVKFEGRPFGEGAGGISPAWSTLTGDVIDENTGRVMVVGAQGWWPPHNTLTPRFARWRDPIWPIIRITFDVAAIGTGSGAPADLVDAAASLARFWFDRDLAGAGESAQIGMVQQEWLNEPVPAAFLGKLQKHLRNGKQTAWV